MGDPVLVETLALPLTYPVKPARQLLAWGPELVRVLSSLDANVKSLATDFNSLAANVKRIADRLDPPPSDLAGSPEIARRLGQTPTWIAEMARNGSIPKNCLVPGTGNGKPWKFYRNRIEEWIKSR